MSKYLAVCLFILIASASHADDMCATINSCTIRRITFEKAKWKPVYTKEMDLKNLCYQKTDSSHGLQLEPELGIALDVFLGDQKSPDIMKRSPRVQLDIYSYKKTHVLTNASIPLNGTGMELSHRLATKDNSFLEVSCFRK